MCEREKECGRGRKMKQNESRVMWKKPVWKPKGLYMRMRVTFLNDLLCVGKQLPEIHGQRLGCML